MKNITKFIHRVLLKNVVLLYHCTPNARWCHSECLCFFLFFLIHILDGIYDTYVYPDYIILNWELSFLGFILFYCIQVLLGLPVHRSFLALLPCDTISRLLHSTALRLRHYDNKGLVVIVILHHRSLLFQVNLGS